jgi:drug/metabolite transporter (DMT)-like permease
MMLILCNLFWAGNYVFGKYVTAVMTPLWITVSRWFLATIILIPLAHYIEKPDWNKVKESWLRLLIMGFLGIAFYNLCLYTALYYTSPTNAALVTALNPGIIVIFSAIILKDKISKLQIVGLLFSLFGVAVILTNGNMARIIQASYNFGDLLMLLAITAWAIYCIMQRALKDLKPITISAAASFFATLILLPFALYQGIDLSRINSLAVVGIVYMAIFPSIGSLIFWNISISEIGASRAGVFINLVPVFTALISWFLGDKISLAQIIGGILVFIGVYLTTGLLEKFIQSKKERQGEIPNAV